MLHYCCITPRITLSTTALSDEMLQHLPVLMRPEAMTPTEASVLRWWGRRGRGDKIMSPLPSAVPGAECGPGTVPNFAVDHGDEWGIEEGGGVTEREPRRLAACCMPAVKVLQAPSARQIADRALSNRTMRHGKLPRASGMLNSR